MKLTLLLVMKIQMYMYVHNFSFNFVSQEKDMRIKDRAAGTVEM